MNYKTISFRLIHVLRDVLEPTAIHAAGSRVFGFACQQHPAEAAMEAGAIALRDWVLTLGDKRFTAAPKEELLVAFIRAICPPGRWPQVEDVLTASGIAITDKAEQRSVFMDQGLHPTLVRRCYDLFREERYEEVLREVLAAQNEARMQDAAALAQRLAQAAPLTRQDCLDLLHFTSFLLRRAEQAGAAAPARLTA